METPVHVLSQAEITSLLDVPDRTDPLGLRDAAVLSTLYYAAATAGELAQLDLGDVQLRRHQIVLRGDDDVRRRVPMTDELEAVLELYKSASRRLMVAQSGATDKNIPALFLSNRAQRLRVQDVRQILGTTVKAAGIDGEVNLSTLRLSRAWHLREEGRSPQAIQRFLGATSRSGRNVL